MVAVYSLSFDTIPRPRRSLTDLAADQRDFSPHRSNSKTASLQKTIVSDCGSLYHIFAHLSTIVENFTVFPCKFQQNVPNRAIFSHFFHFFIKFSQIIVIYSRFPSTPSAPPTPPTPLPSSQLPDPHLFPRSPLPFAPPSAPSPRTHTALSPSARPKSHFFQNFSCIIPLYVL